MPRAVTCSVCLSENTEHAELLGTEALEGKISWSEAERRTTLRRAALQNHMQKHVVAPAVYAAEKEATDEFDALIAEAKRGLMEQFYFAPNDVKPIILTAIHNLEGLRQTKPNQELLVKALKTVQEMTGMKNEQRMLLGFAKAMFKAPAIDVTPLAELTEETP